MESDISAIEVQQRCRCAGRRSNGTVGPPKPQALEGGHRSPQAPAAYQLIA